jgi:NhaA family Na+:H+ antiporter
MLQGHYPHFAAALAMLLANTGATSGIYHSFLETPVQLRVGALEINKNMLLWINDALMAVFFLLIGLEVKREMIQGRWPAAVRPFSRSWPP